MVPTQTRKVQVLGAGCFLFQSDSDALDRIAKKEAKRLEKEAKLAAKAAKKVATTPKAKDGATAGKKDKAKDEEEEFVNTTPKGQKKGTWHTALTM